MSKSPCGMSMIRNRTVVLFSFSSFLLLLLLLLSISCLVSVSGNPTNDTENDDDVDPQHFQRLFMDCDIETYYASVRDENGWWKEGNDMTLQQQQQEEEDQEESIRNELALLLHKTHRQMLSITNMSQSQQQLQQQSRNSGFTPPASSSDMPVSMALQDLDAGQNRPNTVHMLFTQTELPADSINDKDTNGWEPGYLWDMHNILTASGGDEDALRFAQSDLHNLVPRHVNLHNDVALQNLYYGNCYQCYFQEEQDDGEQQEGEDEDVLFHDSDATDATDADARARDRLETGNGQRSSSSSSSSIYSGNSLPHLCLCPEQQALQPPEEARGRIARALLYMELRYGTATTASDGLGLQLTDCAPSREKATPHVMGYFSKLVQWHLEYPPSDAELQRNDKVCNLYQGNRNPFVDFPEDSWSLLPFARVDEEKCAPQNDDTTTTTTTTTNDTVDGDASSIPDESTENGVTTPEQDMVVVDEEQEPNEEESNTTGRLEDDDPTVTYPCDEFMAGDINFNMVDPISNSFGLVALVDVPGDMELFVLSYGWDEQQPFWATSDTTTTIQLIVPSGGIQPAGKPFGYGDLQYLGDAWQLTSTDSDGEVFDISTNGAELFLYCIDSSNSMHGIAAISTMGQELTSLPSPLTPYGYGVMVLPTTASTTKYRYTGPAIGNPDLYAKALISIANWNAVDNDGEMPPQNSATSVTTEVYGIGNSVDVKQQQQHSDAIDILPPRQSSSAWTSSRTANKILSATLWMLPLLVFV